MKFTTKSPAQTEAVGAALGRIVPPGTVIAYRGGLGAGKTAFTRGLARGLEYISGRLPLFHFDMYRLASADDLFDIGWEDYLDRGGVCAVEWSENVAEAMEQAVVVTIRRLDEDSRCITLEGGDFLENLSL